MTSALLNQAVADLCPLAAKAASGSDPRMTRSAFAREVAAFGRKQGSRVQTALLRGTLARLVEENGPKIDGLNYPAKVLELVHAEFQRLRKFVPESEDEYFDLDKLPLRCDFCLACFSRIPLGVEHIERSGVPRSLCIRGGIGQFLKFLRVLRWTGGCRPFYEAHLAHEISPLRFFRTYNEAARKDVYHNVAACLEMNPRYRGLMTGSWWFDPQIEKLSPRLPRLADVMLQNGAVLFRYKTDSSVVTHALENSPARRKLHEEGKYHPAAYMVVWPRDALLAWAKASGTSSAD